MTDPIGWQAMSDPLAQPPTVEHIITQYAAGVTETSVWPDRPTANVLARSQIREWLSALAHDIAEYRRGRPEGTTLTQLLNYTA